MEIIAYPFFQRALAGIAIISVAVAIIGVYIMSRRMVFISGGITHACFGGLGFGYWLGINPIAMAAVAAVAGSLGVQWLSGTRRVRSDSAIAVIWALGMALGIMFIFMTEGYVPELNSFLFGNVLTVTNNDLLYFSIFTGVLILVFTLFFRTIVAVAFDPDFARVSHLPVTLINTVMTVLVAVAIVLTIRLVGIMLLMSLLSLPQMIAETRYRRFSSLIFASIAIALFGGAGGLFLAYILDVPASATIVLLLVVVYAVASVIKR
ncbi:MAG: metal ABC transporter permease [Lachnospiraceae bacterium]|nr:metal ABC transporter permease [Lachnospiraceae bacterium]